jgi:hypothetical protein
VAERLRDHLFTTGQKLVKVLDPAVSWRSKNKEELWGDDAVHPKEEAYKLMAEGVISINTGMESGAKKRARTNSIETGFTGPGTTLNRNQSQRGGGHGSAHRGAPNKRANGAVSAAGTSHCSLQLSLIYYFFPTAIQSYL